MRMLKSVKTSSSRTRSAIGRAIAGVLLMSFLVACSTESAREAELAREEAVRVASEQIAAQMAQQQQAAEAAEADRAREELRAEQARLQAQREQRAAEATARAEQERQRREVVERREQERLAAIAAVQAERQAKVDRIADLEEQIAAFSDTSVGDDDSAEILQQAITVAEELLDVLSVEQAKYEETDAQGNTLEPLQKDLIAELQARKDDLVRRARAQ
ncbi:MAG: hypothetical protein HOF74_08740 [Gammaproteobacteria bacterium]|jgi:hypothetical protein|nr:hypothetical protein [Gammaproteobacteria bacterium]MBT3859902.1 hypothetical protein [Gammaproteobacteria bacterium]MBT3986364.1 hypothetical protein [Gammaproteobacteria bacterium]MBT4582924.1 hypothetical protein [Gammaproteobacteria bacterium]MBT4658317.1 hypothetical protein [Gammaproteobacteria bacterium]